MQAGEKVESAKAGAIAGAGGTLASLPYILAAGHPPLASALSVGTCLASCLLFGVTFRYAVRQDLQNLQLKVIHSVGLCCYNSPALAQDRLESVRLS